MINQFKKLTFFRLLILEIQFKTGQDKNIGKFQTKIFNYDNDKQISTQELNQLMAEISATKLAQVKLATKADIFDLIKKTDFDVKLKKMIKKVP